MQMQKMAESVVESTNEFLFHATHAHASGGKIIVLVNTDVGTWDGVKTHTLKGKRDRSWKQLALTTDNFLRVNDNGDLFDYVPETANQTFTFKLNAAQPGETLCCIPEGKPLATSEDGKYAITLRPGGGASVFLGTPSEAAGFREALAGQQKPIDRDTSRRLFP